MAKSERALHRKEEKIHRQTERDYEKDEKVHREIEKGHRREEDRGMTKKGIKQKEKNKPLRKHPLE